MRRVVLLGMLATCGVPLVLVALARADPPAGGESTAKTAPAPLKNKDGAGVPGVTMTCVNTLGAKGEITITCELKNTTKVKKTFVMCMMLDLKKDKQGTKVSGLAAKDKKNYVLVPKTKRSGGKDVPVMPPELECKPDPGAGTGSSTSYHLGCKLIVLDREKTEKVEWKGKGAYIAPDKTNVQASDFWINYADTVDLSAAKLAGAKLDEKSCEAIIGQGQFLEPKKVKPVDGVTAWWIAKEAPFTDPTAAYQATTFAQPAEHVYALFDDWPCAPPNLPEERPPLDPCPAPPRVRPPTDVDLNLYWFDSAAEPAHETYPAVLRTRIRHAAAGVRLVTDPPAGKRFVIRGSRRRYGSIRACAAANRRACVAPSVPEGTRLSYQVDVVSSRARRSLFTQFGDFVQDTQPPVVRAVRLAATPNGVSANVAAFDATTSPIAATLWTSNDGGASWQATGLQSAGSLLAPGHTRSFAAQVAMQGALRCYVVVQDELYNTAWFGPQTVEATSPA